MLCTAVGILICALMCLIIEEGQERGIRYYLVSDHVFETTGVLSPFRITFQITDTLEMGQCDDHGTTPWTNQAGHKRSLILFMIYCSLHIVPSIPQRLHKRRRALPLIIIIAIWLL